MSLSGAISTWVVPYVLYKLEHSADRGARRFALDAWARLVGAMARASDVVATELVRGGCGDTLAALLASKAGGDDVERIASVSVVPRRRRRGQSQMCGRLPTTPSAWRFTRRRIGAPLFAAHAVTMRRARRDDAPRTP